MAMLANEYRRNPFAVLHHTHTQETFNASGRKVLMAMQARLASRYRALHASVSWNRADKVIFGYSTGELRAQGVRTALLKGAVIAHNAIDQAMNTLIFGGTGSGKTSKILAMVMQRLLEILIARQKNGLAIDPPVDYREMSRLKDRADREAHFDALDASDKLPGLDFTAYRDPGDYRRTSIFALDAKGALWKGLANALDEANQLAGGNPEFRLGHDRLVVIGAGGPGQRVVDLLRGKSPGAASNLIFTVYASRPGVKATEIWPQLAKQSQLAMLVLARAYALTDEGIEHFVQHAERPYSIAFITRALRDTGLIFRDMLTSIFKGTQHEDPAVSMPLVDMVSNRAFRDAVDVLYNLFNMYVDGRKSIQINVDAICGPWLEGEGIRSTFASGFDPNDPLGRGGCLATHELWGRFVATALSDASEDEGKSSSCVIAALKADFMSACTDGQAKDELLRASIEAGFKLSPAFISAHFQNEARKAGNLKHDDAARLSKAYVALAESWGKAARDVEAIGERLRQAGFGRFRDSVHRAIGQAWGARVDLCAERVKEAVAAGKLDMTPLSAETIKNLKAPIEAFEMIRRTKLFELAAKDPNKSRRLADEPKFESLALEREGSAFLHKALAGRRFELFELYTYMSSEKFGIRDEMHLMIDEYQAFVAADESKSGKSDLDFPNVSRSTGCRIWAMTQSIPALRGRLDNDNTLNLLANFRTMVLLKCEDKETADYFNARMGKTTVSSPNANGVDDTYEARLAVTGMDDPAIVGKEARERRLAQAAAHRPCLELAIAAAYHDPFVSMTMGNGGDGRGLTALPGDDVRDLTIAKLQDRQNALENQLKVNPHMSRDRREKRDEISSRDREGKAKDLKKVFQEQVKRPHEKLDVITPELMSELGMTKAIISIQSNGMTFNDIFTIDVEVGRLPESPIAGPKDWVSSQENYAEINEILDSGMFSLAAGSVDAQKLHAIEQLKDAELTPAG